MREYLVPQGPYRYKLLTTQPLADRLQNVAPTNDLGYLGTSEGWVSVRFEPLTPANL